MSLSSINAHPRHNTLFNLSHLSIIKVLGENAEAFLQGQLTCDITTLNENQALKGALCNIKGRVLALLYVIQFHNEILLVLPNNLLEQTIKSLAKTAALSRVTLEEEKTLHCVGAYYTETFQNPFFTTGLGHQFYLCVTKEPSQENTMPYHLWHQYQLMHGEVSIYPETRGLFLPHELQLQHTGYLSFNKGCYKGQEVIARMHYLGKLKYSFQLFSIHTSENIKPGLKLFDANHTPIGELLDCVNIANNNWLIATSIKPLSEHEIYIENYSELMTRDLTILFRV